MKKVILFLIMVISLFSENIVVWMDNSFDPRINKIIKSAVKNSDLEEAKIVKYKEYEGLYSLIINPQYYKYQVKLVDGLLADKITKKDAFYNIIKIEINDHFITIKGVKFDKENKKAVPLTLRKKISNNLSKELYRMLIFYFNFPLYDFDLKNAKSIPALIIKNNNKNMVYYYKSKDLIVTKEIDEDLVEKALELHLISKKSPYEFCKLLSMRVANKIFSNEDEISLEDYYLPYNFKIGFLIRKYKDINYYKPFKCEDMNGLAKENFDDFILNKVGVEYYKKINFFPIAAILTSYGPESAVSDENGKVMIEEGPHENFYGNFNSSILIGLKKIHGEIKPIYLLDNYKDGELYFLYTSRIKINNNREVFIDNKKIDLDFKATYGVNKNGTIIIGGYNGNLVKINNKKINKKYKGIEGDVLKIKFIDNTKFGVITSNGEFVIYDINKETPIRVFPLLGYSYADFDFNDNYFLLVNQNYFIYWIKKEIFLKGVK